MIHDNTLQLTNPALSLEYTVSPDSEGRLRFTKEHVEIIYRNGYWIATNGIDVDRFYIDLEDALVSEAMPVFSCASASAF